MEDAAAHGLPHLISHILPFQVRSLTWRGSAQDSASHSVSLLQPENDHWLSYSCLCSNPGSKTRRKLKLTTEWCVSRINLCIHRDCGSSSLHCSVTTGGHSKSLSIPVQSWMANGLFPDRILSTTSTGDLPSARETPRWCICCLSIIICVTLWQPHRKE